MAEFSPFAPAWRGFWLQLRLLLTKCYQVRQLAGLIRNTQRIASRNVQPTRSQTCLLAFSFAAENMTWLVLLFVQPNVITSVLSLLSDRVIGDEEYRSIAYQAYGGWGHFWVLSF